MLRADGLVKSFGGVCAVDSVDLVVTEGAVHSIIGPNGAGKTTLLNLLSGIYRPEAGEIHLGAERLTARAAHEFAAAGIGRTFQNLQIFFNMSVRENVMAGAWLHEACGLAAALLRLPRLARSESAARARALELLELVGLTRYADEPADALPYGALKRLEIARALAARPRLVLLDEPAAGLNPTEIRGMDELIRRIADLGITVVLVEHNMKLVMEVSQHVIVLDHGRKLAEGAPAEVSRDARVVEAYLGATAC